MLRKILSLILRLALRVFFRRIEIGGLQHLPESGPIMLVLNHPNALVDPAVLLCFSPRPVAFLAKAPLFRTPVLGMFTRAFDSLPVYRSQDQAEDPIKRAADNQKTFAAARKLLQSGHAIAIFPEGTSHSDPQLKPIKTGAARLALGANLLELSIVPAGLYYSDKAVFRSDALLYFGEPFAVKQAAVDSQGEPQFSDVQALTQRIAEALAKITLQAEDAEVLHIIERISRLFAEDGKQAWTLEEALILRRQLVAGYDWLHAHDHPRLQKLLERLVSYEQGLAVARVKPEPHRGFAPDLLFALRGFLLVLAAPFATVGVLIHYPAYRLSGTVAARVSGDQDDMLATVKVLAALLFFPLTWLVLGIAVGIFTTPLLGATCGCIAPLLAYLTLVMREQAQALRVWFRGVRARLHKQELLTTLAREREAIRAEVLALASEFPTT